MSESIRIEIAFYGGQLVGAAVAAESVDALEQAVVAGLGGTLQLDTEDGRLTVVVGHVAYVRRYARDARPGFGIA